MDPRVAGLGRRRLLGTVAVCLGTVAVVGAGVVALAAARTGPPSDRPGEVRMGQGALGDWTTDAPGVRRRITANSLPPPYASRSADADTRVVRRPQGAWPRVPAGFRVDEFQTGLSNPRLIRTAPNGDV